MALPGSRCSVLKLNHFVNLSHIGGNLCSSSKSRSSLFHNQRRTLQISSSRNSSKSYEPDGKTTVTILNDEKGAPLMIDAYHQRGFRLNNGMHVLGPMAIFPKTVLGWDVGEPKDISPASLVLFSILEPRPDILIVGVGDQGAKLPLDTVQFLRKKKLNIEILATEHACTTFNFLSVEGRRVAAVMLPPQRIIWTGEDMYNFKLDKRRMYEPLPDPNDDPFDAKNFTEKFRKLDKEKNKNKKDGDDEK